MSLWRSVRPEVAPELLGLYDERYLDHQDRDVGRILEAAEQLRGQGPKVVEIGANSGELVVTLGERALGIEYDPTQYRLACERLRRTEGLSLIHI